MNGISKTLGTPVGRQGKICYRHELCNVPANIRPIPKSNTPVRSNGSLLARSHYPTYPFRAIPATLSIISPYSFLVICIHHPTLFRFAPHSYVFHLPLPSVFEPAPNRGHSICFFTTLLSFLWYPEPSLTVHPLPLFSPSLRLLDGDPLLMPPFVALML